MTEKRGWKVLVGNSTRTSCVARGDARVHYNKNVETFPKKAYGPLCVFDSKQAAYAFIKLKTAWPDFMIVECRYKKSKHKKIWDGCITLSLSGLPRGTVLADSVTCLE